MTGEIWALRYGSLGQLSGYTLMTKSPVSEQIDPRIKIAALWVSVLLIFAYVDIFAFFRSDVLNAALNGQVADIQVSQRFLLGTTIYILVPCLMVSAALFLQPKANGWTNVILASLYAISIAISCIGEVWIYYWIGSAAEIALLGAIVVLAWNMRR